MFKRVFCATLFSLSLSAQSAVIASAGYVAPAPVSAAPGQILTVFVTGLNISTASQAPSGALPNSLSGVTATLRQGSDHAAPIVDVRPVYTCPDALTTAAQEPACATLTAVTVQIPYELILPCPACAQPALVLPELFISANGQNTAAIELNALADQTHILTACDIAVLPFANTAPPNTTGLGCAPVVTHQDGSTVSASNPAKVGETITAWAVGLGQTNPAASTGQPAASPAPTQQAFVLDFNYSLNARATKPYAGRPDSIPIHPLFAGLASGYAGLYQINFVVPPQPLNGTPLCGVTGTSVVQSNLTVSFGGEFSFDGASICVATRIPID